MPAKTAKAKPVKPNGPKGSIFQKINQSLAIIFYLMWIVIGLFFILLIVANIRQGVFRQLFASEILADSFSKDNPNLISFS